MWAVDYVAPHHLRRGQTIIAIESSSPANAGMTARPVIQVRSISAAVALSRPKLAHETFAAAASAPGSEADIDTLGGNGIATAALSAASAVRSTIAAPWSTNRSALGLTGFRCGVRCALGCRNLLRTLLFNAHRLFDRFRAHCDCVALAASGEPRVVEDRGIQLRDRMQTGCLDVLRQQIVALWR
jgi:hypothetical protein